MKKKKGSIINFYFYTVLMGEIVKQKHLNWLSNVNNKWKEGWTFDVRKHAFSIFGVDEINDLKCFLIIILMFPCKKYQVPFFES